MAFNNLVNIGIAFGGLLDFFAGLGGLAFLFYWVMAIIDDYKSNKADSKEKCETCIGYNACFDVCGDTLPEDGCAYYKSIEEVEISAN